MPHYSPYYLSIPHPLLCDAIYFLERDFEGLILCLFDKTSIPLDVATHEIRLHTYVVPSPHMLSIMIFIYQDHRIDIHSEPCSISLEATMEKLMTE